MSLFSKEYSYKFTTKHIDNALDNLNDLKLKVGKHFDEMNISNTTIDDSIEVYINELKTNVDNLIIELNTKRNLVKIQK